MYESELVSAGRDWYEVGSSNSSYMYMSNLKYDMQRQQQNKGRETEQRGHREFKQQTRM